jgi:hypothetical protein
MATIEEYNIPEIGTGILMPQLQHQWRLRFTGENIPFTDIQRNLLRSQIVSCGLDYHLKTLSMDIEQNKFSSELHTMIKKFSTIAKSGTASDKVSFIVDMMDGSDKVLNSFSFTGCSLIAHKFDLSYANPGIARHHIKFSYKTTKEV